MAILGAGCAKSVEDQDVTAEPDVHGEDGVEGPDVPAEGDLKQEDLPSEGGVCTFHAECDDGVYCNGVEHCISGRCQAGDEILCSDGVECTTDSCDEATKSCRHAPEDAKCDDHLPCNGLERCTLDRGCVPGAGAVCNDDFECTRDSCDEGTGACTHEPDDSLCDDENFCNGPESCTARTGTDGCEGGTAPDCTEDDGIACTIEECSEEEGACVHRPDDSRCDNDVFCDGREVCDAATSGCRTLPVTCDDGNACTIDECDTEGDACVNMLIDGDGDGFPPASCGGPDCNDGEPAINPSAVEVCDDTVDNNCNGKVDVDDYGCCTGSNDACACPLDVSAGGTFTGETATAGADYDGGCGSSGGKDRTFYLHLRGDADVTLATEGSAFDTVLYVRSGTCADGAEVECDDDGGSGNDSLIERMLTAGDYFIIVDGFRSSASGDFTLTVTVDEITPATPVTGNDLCAGAVDVSAGGCFSGDTTSMRDDYQGAVCGSTGGKDVVFVLTLAATRTVHLDTNNSSGITDTLLYIREGSCMGTEVECDDDDGEGAWSLIERSLNAGTYYVFVDGYSSLREGAYRLCVELSP